MGRRSIVSLRTSSSASLRIHFNLRSKSQPLGMERWLELTRRRALLINRFFVVVIAILNQRYEVRCPNLCARLTFVTPGRLAPEFEAAMRPEYRITSSCTRFGADGIQARVCKTRTWNVL